MFLKTTNKDGSNININEPKASVYSDIIIALQINGKNIYYTRTRNGLSQYIFRL